MLHLITTLFRCLIGLVTPGVRRGEKARYLTSYIYYFTKYILFWKILHIPLHTETVAGKTLRFFHYSIFLSLYGDMFLNDDYYLQLPSRPKIIDLGSEVGISTCYFKTIYPKSTVMAFEPDPESCALLTSNIKSFGWSKTTAFNLAIANKKGKMPFYVDAKVPGSLTMSLYEQRQQKKILVEVARLSRFITQKIDLLKIDIEGAEQEVIDDLVKSRKIFFVKNMIIEFHHHIDPTQDHLSRMLANLEKAGFGYQIKAQLGLPFQKRIYQDFLIFAYRE